jgi:hypothetical protein
MGKCHNKNLTTYKNLKKVFKTDIITNNVINQYQRLSKSDTIPTVVEAQNMIADRKVLFNLKQEEFGVALLNNLRRLNIIHSFGGRYYINNTDSDTLQPSQTLIDSNVRRLNRYLEINNIPIESVDIVKTKKTFSVSIDPSIFSATDMLESSRAWDKPRARKVVSHLMRMFPGINVKLMSVKDAENLYASIPQWKKAKVPFNKINSFYLDGTAILINGRVTDEIAIEEVLHPFIDAVKLDNENLFNSLLDEAQRNFPEMTQQIKDAYRGKRRFTEADVQLEIVTQALSRHFNNEYENTPTKSFTDKIKQFLDWFSKIIKNLNEVITGRVIEVNNISEKATLSDIAKLLNTDGISFKLDTPVNGRIRYSLSPEKQKIVNVAKKEGGVLQRRMIDRLFHNVESAKEESDTLSASEGVTFNSDDLVILNKEDGKYYSLTSKKPFISAKEALGRKETKEQQLIKNDLSTMLDAIASHESFDKISDKITNIETEVAKQAFSNIVNQVNTVKSQGDVMLTNVVFHDAYTEIASKADIVLVASTGQLKILQIQLNESNVLKTNPKTWTKGIFTSTKDMGILYGDKKNPYNVDKVTLAETSMYAKLTDTKSLTLKTLDALEVNLLQRMVENMGYDIEYGVGNVASLLVSYNGKKIRFDGNEPHGYKQNAEKVNILIPAIDTKLAEQEISDQVLKDAAEQIYNAEQDIESAENFADTVDPSEYPEQGTVLGALETYEKALKSKQEVEDLLKENIYRDRSKEDVQEEIASTLSYIALAKQEGPISQSRVYTRLLQDALRQMKSFKEYATDPKNQSKKEYITYILNFNRFLSTFEGLHAIEANKELNATQRSLLGSINIELTQLLGNDIVSDVGANRGIIKTAILDYVATVIRAFAKKGKKTDAETVIQSHSGQTITLDDLDELFTLVPDISNSELYAKDLATSKDVILATMDKIFKFKKQEFLDKVQARKADILDAGKTLLELSGEKDLQRLYDFMLEFDDNKRFTGFYTTRVGQNYLNEKKALRDKLYDANGKPRKYFPIYSLANADPIQIEKNKQLYRDKKAFADFMQGEKLEDGVLTSGTFHQYTQEFIDVRKNYEYAQVWSNGEGVTWIKKPGVPQTAYDVYKNKYYYKVEYTKTFKDANREPTGAIKENKNFDAVKPDYVEVKDERSDTGASLLNPKYEAIMNPTDQLGEARKQYYLKFVEHYEDLLKKLPRSQRMQMLGKVPVIANNFVDEVMTKPSFFARMIPKFLGSIKNLFTETSEQKVVLLNEQGKLVDTLPVFYTGNPRVEGQLEKVYEDIQDLKDKRMNGGINVDQYKKERAVLEAEAAKLRSQPTLGEVSTDMTKSLVKFASMAENFEVMGQIEDTLQAMVQALKMRAYKEPGTALELIAKIKQGSQGFVNTVVGRDSQTGLQSNAEKRAHHWMKMVYYDNDKITKGAVDKLAGGLINLSSLSYVAFNIFGNFNNLTLGQINNYIEAAGGLFYTAGDYTEATKMFYTMGTQGMIERTANAVESAADFTGRVVTGNNLQIKRGNYDPDKALNKYEAIVQYFRMMDDDADIREQFGLGDGETLWSRFTNFGYSFNQGAEYKVQSTVGMAMLLGTQISNGEDSLNLVDALDFDQSTGKVTMREGYDTIINKDGSTTEYTDGWRYEMRNNIREVNKQIHGNYAREDRMVIQNNFTGILMAQFHKWVMPAFRARFQENYYDQNLGWLEGRYTSAFKFLNHIRKTAVTGERGMAKFGLAELGKSFKEEYGLVDGRYDEGKANMMLKNVYRTLGEAMILLIIHILDETLVGGDDDDPILIKKLRNFGAYQANRTYKEMVLFNPLPTLGGYQQVYQMLKSPIAATRTLGELGELLDLTFGTAFGLLVYSDKEFNENSKYVYQNKPKKGMWKLEKNFYDVVPVLYTLQKWKNFEKLESFYIK